MKNVILHLFLISILIIGIGRLDAQTVINNGETYIAKAAIFASFMLRPHFTISKENTKYSL